VGLEPGLEMAQYDLTNINVSGTLFAKRAKGKLKDHSSIHPYISFLVTISLLIQ
jgi:hypothetical protein